MSIPRRRPPVARAAARGPAIVLLAALVAAGCAGPGGVSQEATRLYDAYRAVMTPEQQRSFSAEPTHAARMRYAASLGLVEKFEAMPAAHREAILEQELVPGMSKRAIRMAWGEPYDVRYLRDDVEWWIYKSPYSLHLPDGVTYHLYVRGGYLTDYRWEIYGGPDTRD